MKEQSPIRRMQTGMLLLVAGVLIGGLLIPLYLNAENEELYHPTTGHYLSNDHGFLNYWRSIDGERLLGPPVTEVLTENGRPVQYFERGRLEAHTDLPDAPVLLGRIGANYAEALWVQFAPGHAENLPAGTRYFAATGHTLSEPFLSFWQTHGEMLILGYPMSEPLWENIDGQMIQVQYFERGRLEYHPLANGTPDAVRFSPMGRQLAALYGYETAALPPPAGQTAADEAGKQNLQTDPASEAVPEAAPAEAAPEAVLPVEPVAEPVAAPVAAPAPPPAPTPVPAPAPQAAAPVSRGWGKRVVVNLSHQWLYAYEGDVLVFDAPVSTGRDGFNTPPGNFSVYAKNPLQTMSGVIGGEYYSVPNVPNAMYIVGDVAMHGTYWHNQFGTGVRMSHGCINLPLNSAAWLYTWAPIGTPVQVVY